jgi:hypothetical protein
MPNDDRNTLSNVDCSNALETVVEEITLLMSMDCSSSSSEIHADRMEQRLNSEPCSSSQVSPSNHRYSTISLDSIENESSNLATPTMPTSTLEIRTIALDKSPSVAPIEKIQRHFTFVDQLSKFSQTIRSFVRKHSYTGTYPLQPNTVRVVPSCEPLLLRLHPLESSEVLVDKNARELVERMQCSSTSKHSSYRHRLLRPLQSMLRPKLTVPPSRSRLRHD